MRAPSELYNPYGLDDDLVIELAWYAVDLETGAGRLPPAVHERVEYALVDCLRVRKQLAWSLERIRLLNAQLPDPAEHLARLTGIPREQLCPSQHPGVTGTASAEV